MIPNSKEKQSFLQTSGQDAGTQCLSRTRSVFRGHTVPLAPTADAQRLSRLRRSLRKQGKNLHKGSHRSPTTCEKWKNKITEGPNPGNSPGVGASLLRGKLPSLFVFYFRLANGYRAMDA